MAKPKSPREIQEEIRRIKDAVKRLSGFWISESAAAIYALEWALGKRDDPPSGGLGRGSPIHERIASNLLALAQKERRPAKPAAGKPVAKTTAKKGPRRG